MFEISFHDETDASIVYKQLKNCFVKSDSSLSLHNEKICMEMHELKKIKPSMIETLRWFVKKKEQQRALSVLEHSFFYKDIEEQEQILSILQSILNGERDDIPNLPSLVERDQTLIKSLHLLLENPVSFSFESVLTFRLKHYFDSLYQFIEAAIDEYKMEQEYQAFIQQLREVLFSAESKLDEVHLVYETHFEFYDSQQNYLSKDHLKKYINRTHFNNYAFYIDSVVLAPLVSIAPNKLYLYTDHMDHQLVQTIRNIFQERATIKPYQHFPLKKMKVE
ncbi:MULTISPECIES: sporulation protein YtxC [Sutcliffiella]|uniref:Sporulation protein YtxC n=1 Tax=Sutcliffiella cohnii TaxID=33932 RepID=A0A223KTP0_9BACI|nr:MULTISPECIES: sporulation protein YtxC [Sutcliffiella]AST92816.1 hypothetical protein BC6307_16735 [Sutcliffiella cohnii]MED4016237.1 sporulation protein YtxC [Sutcliffiella cohnii]WBL14070.1 sporulation protein YtxC [Sutcliffiella sp. NC1]